MSCTGWRWVQPGGPGWGKLPASRCTSWKCSVNVYWLDSTTRPLAVRYCVGTIFRKYLNWATVTRGGGWGA